MANPKDFQPVSGMKVRDDGVVVNEANGINEDGSQNTKITGSDIQQPVEIQGHVSQVVQAQNAVSVAANTWNNSSFIDCAGFDSIAVNVVVDNISANAFIECGWSNDGVNIHGKTLLSSGMGAALQGTFFTPIGLRYARIQIKNQDSANARTVSALVNMKA
ncbi:hypothetical protein ABFY54_28985 [Priestia megaterium]|uniref:hypothetical protein n=1 Tax=Priestia megaterium TaxID=1404 RepID=UPI003D2823B9